MVVQADIGALETLVDYAWALQSRVESASYPMYQDKRGMREAFAKSIGNDSDAVLACYEHGILVGVMNLLVKQESRYLQTIGIYTAEAYAPAYQALIGFLRHAYAGFELLLGYPKENQAAERTLRAMGASCVESSVTMRLSAGAHVCHPSERLVRAVDEAAFAAFAAFHDAHNPEIYWTSARILAERAKFCLYAMIDCETIVGSIVYGVWGEAISEIFSVAVDEAYRCEEAYGALLSHTLPQLFALNGRDIVYFVEEGQAMEMAAALRHGFIKTGHYQCFQMML